MGDTLSKCLSHRGNWLNACASVVYHTMHAFPNIKIDLYSE